MSEVTAAKDEQMILRGLGAAVGLIVNSILEQDLKTRQDHKLCCHLESKLWTEKLTQEPFIRTCLVGVRRTGDRSGNPESMRGWLIPLCKWLHLHNHR